MTTPTEALKLARNALDAYLAAFDGHLVTNTNGARDFDFTGTIAESAKLSIAAIDALAQQASVPSAADDIAAKLRDPVAVHVAMLRGEIAKPALRDMLHLYGEAVLQRWDSVPSAEPPFDMLAHLKRQAEFSAKTFGPGARVEGVTDHIAKELREVRESGGDLSEWVDVIILAFDGAWRSGASPAQIIDAMVAKQTKNEGRKWPDWRAAPAGKAIEHDRSGEVGPTLLPATATKAQPQPSVPSAEPAAEWLDPRVQAAYEILCSDDTPPPEQHWEGWVARRIVDAIGTAPTAPAPLPAATASVAPTPELDVRRIMLDVVPGEDGMGQEVFAKSIYDVVCRLTDMGQRIEELESQTAPVAPEPITVESVAEVVDTADGLELRWLIEGGIAAMDEGCVLVMPHRPITDDFGHGEVYMAQSAPTAPAPTVQPLNEEAMKWRKAVQEAYGWLWHTNNEPMAPVPMWSPEQAAYQARKCLRELLTTAERGEAINAIAAHMGKIAGITAAPTKE